MAVAVVLSLMFGAGIWLVYEGLTNPQAERAERDWLRPLREFLNRAGLHDVTPRDFLVFSLGAGLACGLAAQLALDWPFVSPLAGLLGAGLPYAYYAHRHERRRAEFQTALADAVGQLRAGIATGLSVSEALTGLARTGPGSLRPHFATLARELRLGSFEEAVWQLRERIADPLLDVVGALQHSHQELAQPELVAVLDSHALEAAAVHGKSSWLLLCEWVAAMGLGPLA